MFSESLSKCRLQKRLTTLKRQPRFDHWNRLGSQAIQDITDRTDWAYKLFFRNRSDRKMRLFGSVNPLSLRISPFTTSCQRCSRELRAGLQAFLEFSNGSEELSALFCKEGHKEIRSAKRKLSRRVTATPG